MIPVPQGIQCKINTLCYKCITCNAPSYLYDCLQNCMPAHTRHSVSDTLASRFFVPDFLLLVPMLFLSLVLLLEMTFPFLSDRNPLWTPSDLTWRYFFFQNNKPAWGDYTYSWYLNKWKLFLFFYILCFSVANVFFQFLPGIVTGFSCPQSKEDHYRLLIDEALKSIEPPIFTDAYTVCFKPIMEDTGRLSGNSVHMPLSLSAFFSFSVCLLSGCLSLCLPFFLCLLLSVSFWCQFATLCFC